LATHLDSLLYNLEREVSGRKIAEIVKEISALGMSASKAVPVLQKIKEKVLHEERYKYTRRMVLAEIEKALAAISVQQPDTMWATPDFQDVSPSIPSTSPRQPTATISPTDSVRTCPQCGTHLREPSPGTLKFCTQCGSPIDVPTPISRSSHCGACGAELPEDAKFCVSCGAAV